MTTTTPRTTFGERLRAWRTALGLTQAELAEQLNIERTTWRKYETDITLPNAGILAQLCSMGLNTNWLLTGEGALFKNEAVQGFPAEVQIYIHHLASSMRELSELDMSTCTMLMRGFAARSVEAVKLARYESGMSAPAPLSRPPDDSKDKDVT